MSASRIAFPLLALVVALSVFQPARSCAETCLRKVKIGVSLPLSAGAVSSGTAVMNSIKLASEVFDPDHCVEFLFEDDQLLPKNTLAAVTKFISVDHVDGLIVYGTPTSIAVGDVVEKNQIPLIALSILGKVVEGKTHIVKHWCPAENLNTAIVAEVKRRGYKNVAIVSTTNDAMLGLRDLFLSSGAAAVSLNEQFLRDDFEFATIISKIKSSAPDAVYVLLYPPQTGPFVKKLREAGYKGDAFGVHNIEDPHEVEVSGDAMLGMWLANGDETAGEGYRGLYKKKFGVETSLGGGNGFDAGKLFLEAFKSGKSANDFLHQVKGFQGAFGVYGATGKNDFDIPAVIKLVKKEGFVKAR